MLPCHALVLPLAMLCVALAGCEPTPHSAPVAPNGGVVAEGGAAAATEAKQGDEYVTAELLNDQQRIAEAKDWLLPKHENHKLWKGDREAIAKLVDDLYAAGAVKVYAVGFDPANPVQTVAMFVAELPADAAPRKKVFSTHNKFWTKYLSEDDPDEVKEFLTQDSGQKYLVLNFDL